MIRIYLILAAISLPGSALSQFKHGTLREARMFGTAAIHGRHIYLAGGFSLFGASLPRIEVYDMDTGLSRSILHSRQRRFPGSAVIGDKVYVAGGIVPPGNASDLLEVVDTFNSTITQVVLPHATPAPGVCAVGSKLFVAGTVQTIGTGSLVQILDVSTGSWSFYPIRYYHASAASDERYAVVAGKVLGATNAYLNIFDSILDQWVVVDADPIADSPSLAVASGKVYVEVDQPPHLGMRAYDIRARTWESIPFPASRRRPYLAAAENFLLVFSENDPASNPIGSVDVLDLITGEWSTTSLGPGVPLAAVTYDHSTRSVVSAGGSRLGVTSDRVITFRVDELVASRHCSDEVANSTGAFSRLNATGSATANDNFCFVTADQLPTGSLGLFLGDMASSAPTFLPGSMGPACLPSTRTPLIGTLGSTDGSGSRRCRISLPSLSFAGSSGAQGGQTVYFQYWHRDAIAGGSTSNFSDSISVVLD